MNRRKFIASTTLAGAALSASGAVTAGAKKRRMKNLFVHHVFFWLKNPGSTADRDLLVAGLLRLAEVATIQKYHIGLPAATSRDVIERGYAVSWLVHFTGDAGQAAYQEDPIHLQFIKECSQLWSKVVVYDSVDV